MSRLSATTARVPPGPRSFAIAVNRCTKSISRFFIDEQGADDQAQVQDCLTRRLSVDN